MMLSLPSRFADMMTLSKNRWFQSLLSLSFRYKAIVKYKTAFYSFYLPVAAAMYIVSVFILYIAHKQDVVVALDYY